MERRDDGEGGWEVGSLVDSVILQIYDSLMLATENEAEILKRVIQPDAGHQ